MDKDVLEGLANKAQTKAKQKREAAETADNLANAAMAKGWNEVARLATEQYKKLMNDSFYYWGMMNAYKGMAAMIGMQEIVDEEKDAEGSCP